MLSRWGQTGYGSVRWFAPAPSQASVLDAPPWLGVPLGFDAGGGYALQDAVSGALPLIESTPDESGAVALSGIPGVPAPVSFFGGITPQPFITTPTGYVYEVDGNIVSGTYSITGDQFWTLELRTEGGALVKEITRHWNGSATFTVDVPPEMSFSSDDEDLFSVSLAGLHEIWLRDWRGTLLGRFEIATLERVHDGPSLYVRVVAQGLIVRLSRSTIGNYTTPVTVTRNEDGTQTRTRQYKSVAAIVGDLLAFQTRAPLIALGAIDPAIAARQRMITLENTTVMDVLRQLQATLPKAESGNLWIDSSLRLNWTKDVGIRGRGRPLSSFAPTPHVRGTSVRIGFDEIATRVYLSGASTGPDTAVTLIDAGIPSGYVQANTATYGIRALRKTDNRVKYPETLLAMANRVLEETSVPYFELEVDAVDLVKADGYAGAVDLWPGATYVLDDSTASVLGGSPVIANTVTYDLSNPLATKIKLATRPKRLSDIVERLNSQVNPTEDEADVLDAREESPLYDSHFGRMLARKLQDAADDDGDLARQIRAAIDDYMARYVPPFQTEDGPNERPLTEAFYNHEDRIHVLEGGGGGADPGDDILPIIADETLPGESEKFAREDHQHQGAPAMSDTSEPELPAAPMLWFEMDSEGAPLAVHNLEKGATGANEFRRLVPCLVGSEPPAEVPETPVIFFRVNTENKPTEMMMSYFDETLYIPGMRWLSISHFGEDEEAS